MPGPSDSSESTWPRARWAIAGFIFLATLAFSLYLYPSLPALMPVHFNAQGAPDGFASKRVAAFLGVICQAVMLAVMALAFYSLRRPDFFGKWGSLGGTRSLPPESLARVRPALSKVMDGFLFSLLLMFGWLQVETNQVALGKKPALGVAIWVFLAVIFLLSGILMAVFIKESGRARRESAKKEEDKEAGIN